ncbi:MAG: glycosyltransferase [Acidimicrobiales bacterium]
MVLPDLVGGGAERVFLDIASGLLARSVSVDIVVVRDKGELRSKVPAGARTVVLGSDEVSRCVPALRRHLRSERPRAVVSALSHMNLATIVADRLVRPRVPVMVTQHNHLSTSTAHAHRRSDRFMPRLIRLGYPFADRIVAVSQGVADDLVATTGLRPDRVEVIYNPVVFDRIAAAAESAVSHPWLAAKTGPVVVAMGRLVDQKDFATLIRAVARLPEECRLVILGEGPARPRLEALAVELGIAGRVDLPGYSANPYPALRAADVFVLSSRWEGLPTVLIEALTFDTPIVATDCPSGPREILDGGAWGRLAPPADPVRLADAIGEALADPRVDRPQARLPYRLETVTQRYLELLDLA